MCSCGVVLRWKADERESDEWLLAAKPDLPDELSWLSLGTASTSAVFCSGCGHLWVAWNDEISDLVEYSPTDPAARPVRRTLEG
jgi:hypothetical protein